MLRKKPLVLWDPPWGTRGPYIKIGLVYAFVGKTHSFSLIQKGRRPPLAPRAYDRLILLHVPFSFISAVIMGAVVGLLCAILCVMFVVYRMRKKDEGSYALDEPKRGSPSVNSYSKPPNRYPPHPGTLTHYFTFHDIDKL